MTPAVANARRCIFLPLVVLSIASLACRESVSESETSPAIAAPTGSVDASGSTQPAAAGSWLGARPPVIVGIPICDEYIEKYKRCVTEHVPEKERVELLKELDTSVEAWKGASGEAKATLAIGCKAALDGASGAQSILGCEW
jgi:hypothetical protein